MQPITKEQNYSEYWAKGKEPCASCENVTVEICTSLNEQHYNPVNLCVYECLSVAYQQKPLSLSGIVVKHVAAAGTALDCHGARICAYTSGICPSLSKEGHLGPHASPHQSPCVRHTALLGVGVTIFTQLFQPHC